MRMFVCEKRKIKLKWRPLFLNQSICFYCENENKDFAFSETSHQSDIFIFILSRCFQVLIVVYIKDTRPRNMNIQTHNSLSYLLMSINIDGKVGWIFCFFFISKKFLIYRKKKTNKQTNRDTENLSLSWFRQKRFIEWQINIFNGRKSVNVESDKLWPMLYSNSPSTILTINSTRSFSSLYSSSSSIILLFFSSILLCSLFWLTNIFPFTWFRTTTIIVFLLWFVVESTSWRLKNVK